MSNAGATASEEFDSTLSESQSWNYNGGDVWYSLFINNNETVSILGSLGSGMALYSGYCSNGQLKLISYEDSYGIPKITYSNLTGVDGTYYIRYWNLNNDISNTMQLCAYKNAPKNDRCQNATLVTHSPTCSPIAGSSLNATESYPGCTGNADDDVWYSFRATSSEAIIEVTGNGIYDAVLEFYSDCYFSDPLSCTDKTLGGQTESYTATNLIVGEFYYYRVYEYYTDTGSNGTFTTCVHGGTYQSMRVAPMHFLFIAVIN